MKMITAIIKPFYLEKVREALFSIGVNGMTVTEVKGYGRQKGHSELYRGSDYAVNFLPKVQLEITVDANKVNLVIEYIIEAAHTGKIGDGKIIVKDIERVIRIRTGETDLNAI